MGTNLEPENAAPIVTRSWSGRSDDEVVVRCTRVDTVTALRGLSAQRRDELRYKIDYALGLLGACMAPEVRLARPGCSRRTLGLTGLCWGSSHKVFLTILPLFITSCTLWPSSVNTDISSSGLP
jgi:hypothetical protein